MYEKIFGEAFVTARGQNPPRDDALELPSAVRDRVSVLIRLTEAQDPFFSALEARDAASLRDRTRLTPGCGGRARTSDHRINNPALYQLSYTTTTVDG